MTAKAVVTKLDAGDGVPWRLSAHSLAEMIARGELSAAESVEAHIARIEEVNPKLNAVVSKRYDEARKEAQEADRRRGRGETLGPLEGVPIAIKECIDLAGTPSTFGISSRAHHRAAVDDIHVARLRAAGAIVLGKTNVPQVLLSFETDNPLYGRTVSPWDASRTPGGSSGGQAAITAAGGVPLGLGTDLGGSSRLPAAYCGIVGFKPSAGRMPDNGRFSAAFGQQTAPSQIGLMSRSVEDVWLGLRVAAGTLQIPLADPWTLAVERLRVGFYLDDGTFSPCAAAVRAVEEAAQLLRASGVDVVEFRPPRLAEAYELFMRTTTADGGRHLARILSGSKRSRSIALMLTAVSAGPVKRTLLGAALRSSGRGKLAATLPWFADHSTDGYFRTTERIHDFRAEFTELLDHAPGGPLDAILSPATTLPALRHGGADEAPFGTYTLLASLLGWPAGVVPITRVHEDEQTSAPRGRDVMDRTASATESGSAGLPIAVQIMGRKFRDDVALALMRVLEHSSPNAPRTPINPKEG
jgi:fatty acid amide hydrolase